MKTAYMFWAKNRTPRKHANTNFCKNKPLIKGNIPNTIIVIRGEFSNATHEK